MKSYLSYWSFTDEQTRVLWGQETVSCKASKWLSQVLSPGKWVPQAVSYAGCHCYFILVTKSLLRTGVTSGLIIHKWEIKNFFFTFIFTFFLLVLLRYHWHTALYKFRLCLWPCHSTPGYLSEENENTNCKDMCTPMFTEALFTTTKIWKQPKWLSTDEWRKKILF